MTVHGLRVGLEVGIGEAHAKGVAKLLLLLPADEAVVLVLPDEHHDGHVLAHGRLELLAVHHEATVARDRHHATLGVHQLGRDGTRHREAHRREAVGDEAGARFVAGVVTTDPDLVGAHVGHEDVVAAHHGAHVLEDAGRLHGICVARGKLVEVLAQAAAHLEHRRGLGSVVAPGRAQDLVDAV